MLRIAAPPRGSWKAGSASHRCARHGQDAGATSRGGGERVQEDPLCHASHDISPIGEGGEGPCYVARRVRVAG